MINASWNILLELAPWLLVGMVIAGAVHGLLPRNFSKRQLQGSGGVLKAVGLGVPLPLCSCGVIPAGLGLKKDGASDGSAIAFLISTPQTGVDSILVAAKFLGWPFALFKLASAALTGVVGGLLSHYLGGASPAPVDSESGSHQENRGLSDMVDHGLDLIRGIWGWLVFGVVASAAITLYVPTSVFEGLEAQGTLVACFAALAVSLPLYVCATASVPMAAAMVAGGMPPGAALVFLMAGPASNLATMGAIYKGFGARNLAVYLGTIVGGSVGLALAFEQIIDPASVQTVLAHAGMHSAGNLAHMSSTEWWETVSAVLLCAMLIGFAAQDARRFLAQRSLQKADLVRSTQFEVQGMTCGGCSGRVEKALRAVAGVENVVVELDPGQATVFGSADADTLKTAVRNIGFTVP
ncbi:MAG: permease [Myxococcota bacterium]|nr:permease [Myxococcota bacterium]